MPVAGLPGMTADHLMTTTPGGAHEWLGSRRDGAGVGKAGGARPWGSKRVRRVTPARVARGRTSGGGRDVVPVVLGVSRLRRISSML